MIIFGWGTQTRRNYGQLKSAPCGICKYEGYSLLRIITWFTLFFIPVIPYSIKHLVLCNNCKNGYDISQEHQEIKELKQRIQDAQDYKATCHHYDGTVEPATTGGYNIS